MTERRVLILSALTLYLFGACVVRAGEAPHIVRIGILIPESGRSETQSVRGLRDALKELGYKERENILVEMRDGKGDRAALKPMANELVGKKVDLIFTTGTRATEVAIGATNKIPIVFRYRGNPQTVGLVKSNTRPGGNVTGVAGFGLEMTGKRLETLQQIVPGVRRVHIFYDLNDKFSRGYFAVARESAEKLGLEVMEHGTKSAEELKRPSRILRRDQATPYFTFQIIWSRAKRISSFARQGKRNSPPCSTKRCGPSEARLARMARTTIRWVARPPAL